MSKRRPGSRFHAALDQRRWAKVRRQVLDRDGWRCRKCGQPGRLECDHIKPLQRGGDPFDMANLQTLCGGRDGCHAAKTRGESRRPDTPAEIEWRAFVAEMMGS